MQETPEASFFPRPQFNDKFRSYFKDANIGEHVVAFSPVSRKFADFVKTVKVRGVQFKSLNLEHVYEGLAGKKNRIYYPSREVPETTWREIRLLGVDFNHRDDGLTALLWAAHTGDRDGMKSLLSSGANPSRKLRNGNTVLMEAIAGKVSTKRLACVELLLEYGVDINHQNEVGHTAFTAATSVGDFSVVKLLRLKFRADININYKTKLGYSAIMLAIAGNHKEVVQYLLDNGADILQEDHEHLTALCWAQVLNPPLAGLLSLRLGLDNKLACYIRRRVELINSKNGTTAELFGLFYQLSFLLLGIRASRCALVQDGALRKITFHPIWQNLDLKPEQLQDRTFYQVLPWIVALSCAMINDENNVVKQFVSNGAGEMFLKDIDDILGQAGGDEEMFMVQSMLFPLMAWETGREFLVNIGFKYKHLLKLFSDMGDILMNKQDEVFRIYQDHMNQKFSQFTLKHWKSVLGKAPVAQICPEPSMSVCNRVRTVYAQFGTIRNRARVLTAYVAVEEAQAALIQEEEDEKLKIEKERAKRQNRRERRRGEFKAAKLYAQQVEKEDTKSKRQSPQQERNNEGITSMRLGSAPLRTLTEESLKTAPTVVNNKNQTLGPTASTSKTNNQTPTKWPTVTTKAEWPKPAKEIKDVGKKKSPEKGKADDRSPYWVKPNNTTTPAKVPTSKPAGTSPEKVKETNDVAGALASAWGEHATKSVTKQIDEDFLFAMSMQQKLDKGIDAVPPKKMTVAEDLKKLNVAAVKKIDVNAKKNEENVKKNEVNIKTNEVNAKNDVNVKKNDLNIATNNVSKTIKSPCVPSANNTTVGSQSDKLPSMPKNAITAEALEKANHAKAVKSECELVKSPEPQEIKAMNFPPPVDTAQSSGDGPNTGKPAAPMSKPHPALPPAMPCIPWVRRSKKWGPQIEKLLALPVKDKVGSMHFTFADPTLYIAKGSEGTIVSVGVRDDGTEVAVKRMLKSHSECIFNELRNLRLPELEMKNIVQYKDYTADAHFGYLALELCEYTLDEYIKLLQKDGQLQMQSKRLVKELLIGLKTLHAANLLHRDLKPRNVLIDMKGTLKLADFGLSKKLMDDQNTLYQSCALGTRCWRPTETLKALDKKVTVTETLEAEGKKISVPYRRSSDIQVAGMITYFILSGGKHPYGQDPAQCEINIRNNKPTALGQEKDDILLGLLAGMLHYEAAKRRTAEQCLRHPFFWSLDRKFEFIQKVRGTSEIRQGVPCKITKILNTASAWVGCQNWMKECDQSLVSAIKLRCNMCNGTLVDFLQFVVDTDEYFSDLPEDLQTLIGNPRKYFLEAYPRLFVAIFEIVRDSEWKDRRLLVDFFQPPKEEM